MKQPPIMVPWLAVTSVYPPGGMDRGRNSQGPWGLCCRIRKLTTGRGRPRRSPPAADSHLGPELSPGSRKGSER
jgi:hypothetical protein